MALGNFKQFLVGEKDFNYKDKIIQAYFLNVYGLPVIYIDENNANVAYVPPLDLFVPADLDILKNIAAYFNQESVADTVDKKDNNVVFNSDLYNIIRPPASGRAVYASQIELSDELKEKIASILEGSNLNDVKVIKEPISPEFYKKGYLIEDNRPKAYLNKVASLDLDQFVNKLTLATEPGRYTAFDSTFENVTVDAFRFVGNSGKLIYLINQKELYTGKAPITMFQQDLPACIEGSYGVADIPLNFVAGNPVLVRYGDYAVYLTNPVFNFDINGTAKLTSDTIQIVFRDRNKPFKVSRDLFIFPLDSEIINIVDSGRTLITSLSTVERYFMANSTKVGKDEIGQIVYRNQLLNLPDAIEAIAKDLMAPALDVENILNNIPVAGSVRLVVIKKGKPVEKLAEEADQAKQYLQMALQDPTDEALGLLFAALSKLGVNLDEEITNVKDVILALIDKLTRIKLLLYIEDPQSENVSKINDLLNFVTSAYKELILNE